MRVQSSSFWRCSLLELGEAVGPAVGDAVRGAGVDHHGVGVTQRRDQLLGRRVGQAEHGDVGGAGDLGALGEVLAVGHRQLEQLDVRAVLQPVMDLQAGGAVLAVDENLGLVAASWSSLSQVQGLKEAGLEKKEGDDGSRSILSSGFTNGAFVTRARLHAACRSGGVATGGGRTVFIAAGYFIRQARCQGVGSQIHLELPG